MKRLFFFILIFILFFNFFSCSETHTPEEQQQQPVYKINDFNIQILPYKQLPYNGYEIISLEETPSDSNGILMYEKNEKLFYHPVIMSEHIIRFLDSFKRTGNNKYLEKAVKYAQKLIDISNYYENTILFPYDFDLTLHNIPEEILFSGWYSGMAQGEALSAFVRLFNVTNNEKYLPIISKIFNGFTNFRRFHFDWFVFVDSSQYYWIEEYPMESATHVLNGFIYAIYGLYDYYLLNKDDISKNLIKASLTTLKHYLPQYRDPGYKSYYCLKHKAQGMFYHRVHIIELKKLSQIAGDSYFKEMAITFENDYK